MRQMNLWRCKTSTIIWIYEKTIDSFCRMAKDGMEATDRKILEIMIEGC